MEIICISNCNNGNLNITKSTTTFSYSRGYMYHYYGNLKGNEAKALYEGTEDNEYPKYCGWVNAEFVSEFFISADIINNEIKDIDVLFSNLLNEVNV